MSGLSMFAKGLSLACDVFCVVDNVVDKFDTNLSSEEEMVNEASFINRLVNLGFSITEVGMILAQCKSENLETLKTLELFSRSTNGVIQFTKEALRMQTSVKGIIEFLSNGVVGPLADINKTYSEKWAYENKKFLDMSPEEQEQATRPIYEIETFPTVDYRGMPSHGGRYVEVGREKVDIEKCSRDYEQFQQGAIIATGIKTIVQVGHTVGHLYHQLAIFLMNNHQQQTNSAPITRQVFDLAVLPDIPAPLHNDVVFQRYTCAINHLPIRHPVGDPTSGGTLYERDAIVNYLNNYSATSPMTRQPLTVSQLLPKPELEALITHRLKYHEGHLWNYVQQSQLLQTNLPVPANPGLQNRANLENSRY